MLFNPLTYTLRYCRVFTHSSSAHVCAIGEVARSDGGVKKQKNDNIKRFLHFSPAVSRSITEVLHIKSKQGQKAKTIQ